LAAASCSIDALRTVSKSTSAILYTEGFCRFVSSTTAPIAAGWSENYTVELPTSHWGIAPFHGAPQKPAHSKAAQKRPYKCLILVARARLELTTSAL